MLIGDNYLKLECNYRGGVPDYDIDYFVVSVLADGFSGHCEVMIQWPHLAELAERLKRYPITHDDPIEANWEDGPEGVQLVFSSAGPTGPVSVAVSITGGYTGDFAVKCQFIVDYPKIEQFRNDIVSLVRKQAGAVILKS